MDDQRIGARFDEAASEELQRIEIALVELPDRVAPVRRPRFGRRIHDADAQLDGHRNAHGRAHGFDQRHDMRRTQHQAGTECAGVHAIAGAAAIQIDLTVAGVFALAGGERELGRVRTADLERDGVLGGIEAQETLRVAMNERRGRDHLGVEQDARARSRGGRTCSGGPSNPSWGLPTPGDQWLGPTAPLTSHFQALSSTFCITHNHGVSLEITEAVIQE